jgi:hypothetical protein
MRISFGEQSIGCSESNTLTQVIYRRLLASLKMPDKARMLHIYNFRTSLASNLYFRTNNGSKGIKPFTFAVVESSVNSGFCGQTLPLAADKLWEKSHPLLSTTAAICYTIAADCSAELWEGVLPRKIEQGHIPH